MKRLYKVSVDGVSVEYKPIDVDWENEQLVLFRDGDIEGGEEVELMMAGVVAEAWAEGLIQEDNEIFEGTCITALRYDCTSAYKILTSQGERTEECIKYFDWVTGYDFRIYPITEEIDPAIRSLFDNRVFDQYLTGFRAEVVSL